MAHVVDRVVVSLEFVLGEVGRAVVGHAVVGLPVLPIKTKPITNHLIPSLRQSVRPPTAVDALGSPPHGSSRLVPSVTSGLRRPCR